MEKFLIDVLVISIGVLLIFSLDKLFNAFERYKSDKELKFRQSDSTLAKYFNEMNNDRNDGWTKLHYNELYYKRLKQIKNGKA
jgi:hypothetical protein